MTARGQSPRLVFLGREDRLLQWKPRLVALATTLVLLAAALGGGVLDFIRAYYLDW